MAADSTTPRPALRLVGDAGAGIELSKIGAKGVDRGSAPKTLGTSALRLAGSDSPAKLPLRLSIEPAQDTVSVAREMREAAQMSALDSRWILAVQVSRGLTGGRAAILTPEARLRLLSIGKRYGLRPFDSSLVIAIVQDAARSGEDELGRNVVERLSMVKSGPGLFPRRGPHWAELFAHTALIVLAAAGFAYLMVRWIGV